MDKKRLFWGYLHINGTIHVKTFFWKPDIEEAKTSPFCKTVIEPFKAIDREEAIKIMKEKLEIIFKSDFV